MMPKFVLVCMIFQWTPGVKSLTIKINILSTTRRISHAEAVSHGEI